MISMRTIGLEKTLKSLAKKIRDIRLYNRKGLIKAGLFIQAEAQRRTPVLTGNLRASAFTVWNRSEGKNKQPRFKDATPDGKKIDTEKLSSEHAAAVAEASGRVAGSTDIDPEVMVGFSAAYALPVHEVTEAKHTVGQAKFLQSAIAENQDAIVKIISKEVKGTL